MRMFTHHYRLLKATPTHPAGRTVRWDGNTQRFYFPKMVTFLGEVKEDIYGDREGPGFTVEQVSNTEWFKPIGKLQPFIPPFPTRKKLDDFVYLTPDCRLVNDVDECRAINDLLNDKGFQAAMYEFYREQYNKFHGLNDDEQQP